MVVALPFFGGRVDRFMVFTLLARRTFDSGRPTPVLAMANSLGMPFETTRRHVAAIAAEGWCRRERGGVMLTGTLEDGPLGRLAPLAHDCLVRFIADLRAVRAIPDFAPSGRAYHWRAGWLLAADLMLAVADSNADTHQDRVNLALFSTILCGNCRSISADPGLAEAHVLLSQVPPPELIRPVRVRALSDRLAIPKATVRRRLERLLGVSVRQVDGGLVIDQDWLASPGAMATGALTWGNVRRLLAALATQGFPFAAPETAYLHGRPPQVPLD